MTSSKHESFSARHRWSGWVNLGCGTIAVFLLAIMLNYFSHRHYTRAWWADSRDRELSPRTQQLLGQITNEVKVIIFYDREETVYPMVQNMLQQYVVTAPSGLGDATMRANVVMFPRILPCNRYA